MTMMPAGLQPGRYFFGVFAGRDPLRKADRTIQKMTVTFRNRRVGIWIARA